MDRGTVAELIKEAINTVTLKFEQQILDIKSKYETTAVDYKKQTINASLSDNETLDVIKSLPNFTGKAGDYISWRESSANSMSLYTPGSRRYFAALTILRNKITDEANAVLTNHGTVLHYEAILSRLDFAYADKRPIHIIEQEMSILKQGNSTLIDYYNLVNEKLTCLINKTTMTHGSNSELTTELNDMNRQKALRIFISGLNGNLANILFSINPSDLPSALAKAQELQSNHERSTFATQFQSFSGRHTRNSNEQGQNHLRFPRKEQNQNSNNQKFQKIEKMETDSSINRYREKTLHNKDSNVQPQRQNTYNNPQRPIFKRTLETSQQSYRPAVKTERINNINEDESFLDEASDCHASEEG